MNQTLPTTNSAERDSEPNNYPLIAGELRRIADAIAPLRTPGRLAISLTLMTPKGDTAEQAIAGVDEMTLAVLGKAGRAEYCGSSWFHLARHSNWALGISTICVQARIPAERDAELARLRAELAALRSAGTESSPS